MFITKHTASQVLSLSGSSTKSSLVSDPGFKLHSEKDILLLSLVLVILLASQPTTYRLVKCVFVFIFLMIVLPSGNLT